MTGTSADLLGYLASALVLATFCTQGMVRLRAVAITSNVAFIAYGALAGIPPVLLLHLILLPVNVCRLVQALTLGRRSPADNAPGLEETP